MGPTSSVHHFLSAAASQARGLTSRLSDNLERKRVHQMWVLSIAVVIIGLCTARSVIAIRSLEHRWTTEVAVVVVSERIDAGQSINSTNTSRVRLPLQIIPAGALRSLRPGSRAAITLEPRTPLTSSMIRAERSRITVPTGWRGIALPADLIAPSVSVGDRVDIVAGGTIVAGGAAVIGVGPDGQITVAVPSDIAATVATAARLGEVSLIVSS